MKNQTTFVATFVIVIVLIFGTVFANAQTQTRRTRPVAQQDNRRVQTEHVDPQDQPGDDEQVFEDADKDQQQQTRKSSQGRSK